MTTAYYNNEYIREQCIAQVLEHQKADEIIKSKENE